MQAYLRDVLESGDGLLGAALRGRGGHQERRPRVAPLCVCCLCAAVFVLCACVPPCVGGLFVLSVCCLCAVCMLSVCCLCAVCVLSVLCAVYVLCVMFV